jgi:uncharacterized protein
LQENPTTKRSDTVRSLDQRLDPRAPLVLDTRELGRRPGSMRTLNFSTEAPAGLGIEILNVPEGSPIDFDLRLEAVMEGVLLTGTARAELEGECSRCLEPIEDDVEVALQQLYVYDDDEDHSSEEDDELDIGRLEGDLLDLEPLLRDAVVLALPFQPLCQDDCPGLCAECGARLADDPDHQHDDPIDPRWAALTGLAPEGPEDEDRDQAQRPGPIEE